MGAAARRTAGQNDGEAVTPGLERLECLKVLRDLTGQFVLVRLLIQLVQAFRAYLCGVSDPREL